MDPTHNPAQVIMAVAASLAFLMSASAFLRKSDDRSANVTFGGIMAVFFIVTLAASRSSPDDLPDLSKAPYALLHMWGVIGLLLGPLIYFHVRMSVDDGYRLSTSRLGHAVPALIHLSLLIPLVIVGPELREEYKMVYIERELYRSFIPGVRIGLIVTSLYVLWSYLWIRRFESHVQDVAAFADESRVRWLKTFILLLLGLFFFLGYFSLGTHSQTRMHLIASIAMALILGSIVLIGLARPHLFHGIPSALRFHADEPDETKYAGSQIDDAQKDAYLSRLRTFFETERPYLEHEITLKAVADETGIPQRYVSQVVNEVAGQHFVDFVNGYRVEAAKTLLTDPSNAHLSVDGIAYDAGFKSRSAFYSAFKKVTGQTPGTFRRNPSPRA